MRVAGLDGFQRRTDPGRCRKARTAPSRCRKTNPNQWKRWIMSETSAPDDERIFDLEEAMRDVVDPELGINVVDLGLVYGLSIEQNEDGTVALIDMTLTSAACPLTDVIEDQSRSALIGTGLVNDLRINWVGNPPWGPDKITEDGREQLR